MTEIKFSDRGGVDGVFIERVDAVPELIVGGKQIDGDDAITADGQIARQWAASVNCVFDTPFTRIARRFALREIQPGYREWARVNRPQKFKTLPKPDAPIVAQPDPEAPAMRVRIGYTIFDTANAELISRSQSEWLFRTQKGAHFRITRSARGEDVLVALHPGEAERIWQQHPTRLKAGAELFCVEA